MNTKNPQNVHKKIREIIFVPAVAGMFAGTFLQFCFLLKTKYAIQGVALKTSSILRFCRQGKGKYLHLEMKKHLGQNIYDQIHIDFY